MAYTKVEIGLYTLDAVWNLCIIFPVLTLYWSGTWGIVDMYMEKLFAHEEILGSGICILIGSFIMIEAYFLFPTLKGVVAVSCWSVKHIVVSRLSIYVCALGILFYWRGVWNITFLVIGNNIAVVAGTTVVALILLILLKSSAGPIGSPFSVQLDIVQDFYNAQPRFRCQLDSPCSYTLDVLFSVYIIMTLNVIAWVGLWKLGDQLILPQNTKQSTIVSLAAGFGISIIIFAFWLPLSALVDRISTSRRYTVAIIQVVFNVVAAVVVLLLWRGLWGLMIDHLATAKNALCIAWVCHVVGFLAMISLQVGRSFGSVGCAIDGEHLFDDWPMEYFIVYYRYRQEQFRVDSQRHIQANSGGDSEANAEEDPLLSSTSINRFAAIQSTVS